MDHTLRDEKLRDHCPKCHGADDRCIECGGDLDDPDGVSVPAAPAESTATPVAPPAEVKRFTVEVEDEKDGLLQALLATMDERLLTVKDFPVEGEPLEWHEQRQLIEKSLALAARQRKGSREREQLEQQAHLLAIPCGCPRAFRRGYRPIEGLRRWLVDMAKAYPAKVEEK
jgi:hypothetical protein